MISVERRYAQVGQRLVHYRCCGAGPPVVMLHDSPRSSRLHLETMRELGRRFRVFALDTPGYGNSAPLDLAKPTIDDFAEALGEALAVLDLRRAPLYATHTSAKIALAYAATQPVAPMLILDGLSIPTAPPDPGFIAAYMRPFRIDDSGGYLASEWTRVRDMLRWFPWFSPGSQTRMTMAMPRPEWIADYVIDLFSAGPHYSDAYAAAMYYDPLPALTKVAVPTRIAARADDVLYPALDRVPLDSNSFLSVERLSADRAAWLEWLESALADGVAGGPASEPRVPPAQATASFYVDLPHGQMRVHRSGPPGERPVLIMGAPTVQAALPWEDELAKSRSTLLPELPGYGESDALGTASAEGIVDAVAGMLEAMQEERVDVLAVGYAAPLAALLAKRHPDRVASIAFDGAPPLDAQHARTIAEQLCPHYGFDPAGAHVHQLWHMLRDSQVQWPWYDTSLEASRKLPPDMRAIVLHRVLVDVLKQPVTYGDSARAGLVVSSEKLYRDLQVPTLLFDHAEDPAYRATAEISTLMPAALVVARTPEPEGAARLLLDFLDRSARESAQDSSAMEIHE